MKKLKKLLLASAVLGAALAGLSGRASAAITVSSPTVAGNVAVTTPTVSGQLTRLKGCILGNDTATASCVRLVDRAAADTTKATLCAGAYGSATYPPAPAGPNPNSGTPGSFSQFFGEDLTFSGAFVVSGSTASASITLTCASLTSK